MRKSNFKIQIVTVLSVKKKSILYGEGLINIIPGTSRHIHNREFNREFPFSSAAASFIYLDLKCP